MLAPLIVYIYAIDSVYLLVGCNFTETSQTIKSYFQMGCFKKYFQKK